MIDKKYTVRLKPANKEIYKVAVKQGQAFNVLVYP